MELSGRVPEASGRPPGGVLGGSGGPLGGVLGASWGALGVDTRRNEDKVVLGGVLGTPWGPLGHLLGSSWGHLGVILGPLGVIFGVINRAEFLHHKSG